MNNVTNTVHGGADVPNAEPSPERRMLHVMRAYNDSLLDQGDEGRANSRAMQAALDAHQSMAGEPVAEVVEWEEDDGTTKHVVSFLCPLAEIPVGAKLYAAPPTAEPAQPVEAVVGVTDQQIIATCDAAGVRWIPEGEDGFPGTFDLTKMSEMRALFSALAHPRPTVVPEARDSDLHASAPDKHHLVARAVWEHMNRRSAPGVIMSMAYTAVLHALSNAAPTVDQAGDVSGDYDWRNGPVEFEDSHGVRLYGYPSKAQALTVGMPDGWKLVPVKATLEMLIAAKESLEPIEGEDEDFFREFNATYGAALAAAPDPVKAGQS